MDILKLNLFFSNLCVHSKFKKLTCGFTLQNSLAVIVIARFFHLLTCLPHSLRACSDFTCVLQQVCHLVSLQAIIFFLKLAASFFATYSQTFSSTPTPETLSIVFMYLAIRRIHWLTGEAVVTRGGSNCATGGRNKLAATEILSSAIFLSQFLFCPKYTLWK